MGNLGPTEPDLTRLAAARALLSVDPANAVVALSDLADQGSVTSMVLIANTLWHGAGVEPDKAKAEAWYIRAADAGSAIGSVEVGKILYAKKDFSRALYRLKDFAESDAEAAYLIGIMYLHGHYLEKNLAYAKAYLDRAASDGIWAARPALGGVMFRGAFGFSNILPGFLIWLSGILNMVRMRLTEDARLILSAKR